MNSLNTTVSVTRALSDLTRIRIWMLIWEEELCVCHITSLMELAPSTVSEHLSVLKKAGLALSRKEGKWVYYKAIQSQNMLFQSLNILHDFLIQDQQIIIDKNKLTKIKGELTC